MSTPRAVWHRGGRVVIGNSQHETCLVAWELAGASVAAKLEAHSRTVRDVAAHCAVDAVATVSFDRTLRVWL